MSDAFYHTAAWQHLRRWKHATDPWCQYCEPGVLTDATEVDHFWAIRNGGAPSGGWPRAAKGGWGKSLDPAHN